MMNGHSFAALAAAAALLAGCGGSAPEGEAAVDADNPLEMTARERGIVHTGGDDPAGVYERRHDLGRDAMCIVSDGTEGWRFSLTAAFGPGLSCRASGRMERDADGWRLSFADGDDCAIVVDNPDDELRMPGKMPGQCDNLCAGRASLAGLRLPRVSWAEADAKALQMRDGQGRISRPCGD